MKTYCVLILSLLMSVSNAQTWIWTQNISSDGPDIGNAIAYDGSGNIYVAGEFYQYNGPVVIKDSTITDNALIKYSKTGNLQWALNVNGLVKDLATDAEGNIYMTGLFENTARFGDSLFTSEGQMDIFAAKINPAGKFIWAKHAGGSGYDESFGIAAGNDNTVVVTALMAMGAKVDGVIINSLGGGIMLIKYSLAGNLVWAKQKGYNDKPMDIKIDVDNNIFVSGVFSFSSDFGGITTIPGIGNNDGAFLAKYNSSGDYIWAATGLSSGNNNAQSLVLDNNNNVYITGYFEDTIDLGSNIALISNTSMKDIFIAKYNSDGQIQWAKRNGKYDIDVANAIALQGNHVFITGFIGVDYPTSTDIFVKAYDLEGNYLMSVQVDSSDRNEGTSIATDEDGNVYITGRFQNSLNFDPLHSINSFTASDFDFFIAKLMPAFAPLNIQTVIKSAFSIYPNPLHDNLTIRFDHLINTQFAISLLNPLGQVVYFIEKSTDNEGIVLLEVPSLSNGTYFIVFRNKTSLYSAKIIIQ